MSNPSCGRAARLRAAAVQLVVFLGLSLPAVGSDDGARKIASSFEHAALVVCVQDAATLWKTDEISLFLEYVGEVAGTDAIAQSWRVLSDSLGWDEDQAFDHVLGSSFAVILDDREDPNSWIIISEVSKATAKRIGARLRIVPKAQVGGIPVVGVEGDSIAGATIALKDSAILVLTRDRRLKNFRRAIRIARELDKMDGHGRVPGGQISVVSRDWPHDGAVVSASGSQREGGWKILATIRSAELSWGLGTDRPRWSAPALSISDDVLFQVHAPIALLELEDLAPLAMGGRTRDDRPGLDEFGPAMSMTARAASQVGGVTLTLAVPVRGIQRSAPKGDAMISAIINRLSDGRIGRAGFGGLHPEAMRVSEARGLDPFVADPAVVSWNYARRETGGGWLLIDAAPAAGAGKAPYRLERARDSAADGSRAQPKAYLTTGWLRPAALLEAMREDLPSSESRSELLGMIEWVSWRIWRGKDEEISGEFEIELEGP